MKNNQKVKKIKFKIKKVQQNCFYNIDFMHRIVYIYNLSFYKRIYHNNFFSKKIFAS